MKMNWTGLLLLTACALLAASVAQAERYGNLKGSRVPEINILQAVDMVKAHHMKTNSELGEIFVDEAVYKRTEEKAYWEIGVRLKKHETGHFYFEVSPDGQITATKVVKDG